MRFLDDLQEIGRHETMALLVGAWRWDLRRDLVECDQSVLDFREINFTNRHEVPAHLFAKSIHADDYEQFTALFERAAELSEPYLSEHRVVTLDGTVKWSRVIGYCTSVGTIPVSAEGITFDVTAIRRPANNPLAETVGAQLLRHADAAMRAAVEMSDADARLATGLLLGRATKLNG